MSSSTTSPNGDAVLVMSPAELYALERTIDPARLRGDPANVAAGLRAMETIKVSAANLRKWHDARTAFRKAGGGEAHQAKGAQS